MTDTVPAVVDPESGLSTAPFEMEERLVETKQLDSDGNVVVLDEGRYDLPVKPKNLGNQFRAGALWTGNKGGRPKGVKNRITVQRLLMEEQLRDRLAVNAPDLLEKAVLMALAGDAKIMGLLLDKLMASPKNEGDSDAKDTHISVTIKNTTQPDKPVATVSPARVRVITSEIQEPIDGVLQ